MKPVQFHPKAISDTRQAIVWYSKERASAALSFSAELRAAYLAIQISPQRYPIYLHGTRRRVLNRYPFSVIYLERLDSIYVLAVAHAKRKPGFWKNRT